MQPDSPEGAPCLRLLEVGPVPGAESALGPPPLASPMQATSVETEPRNQNVGIRPLCPSAHTLE